MCIRDRLRILWGLCCLLLLCMAVGDCIQFAKHPERYPIGSEGLDWVYEASENYALGCGMDIGWCIIGIAGEQRHVFREIHARFFVHCPLVDGTRTHRTAFELAYESLLAVQEVELCLLYTSRCV